MQWHWSSCRFSCVQVHIVAQLEPSSQINGYVVLMDFEGLGMKQVKAMTPHSQKRLLTFIQEAMPGRLKEVHFVKQPFIFNMVWTLFKPFVKEKLKNRVRWTWNGPEILIVNLIFFRCSSMVTTWKSSTSICQLKSCHRIMVSRLLRIIRNKFRFFSIHRWHFARNQLLGQRLVAMCWAVQPILHRLQHVRLQINRDWLAAHPTYSIKTFYIKPNSAARVNLQLLRASQLFSLDITQNKLLNLMCRNLLRCHRWQIEKKWKLFSRSSRQSKFASYHNFAFASTERKFIKMKNGFFPAESFRLLLGCGASSS